MHNLWNAMKSNHRVPNVIPLVTVPRIVGAGVSVVREDVLQVVVVNVLMDSELGLWK